MGPSSGNSSAASPFAEAAPTRPGGEGSSRVAFRRIHIRFTREGVAAIGLLLAAGIVADNAGNNLLYLVVASLLALLSLSGVLGYANLRGLVALATPPDEIYAGLPATVRLDVGNSRRLLPAYLIAASDGSVETTLHEIAAGARAAVPVTVTFQGRGRQPYPEITLLSTFPFGLVRRGGSFRPTGLCTVYPRPLPVAWEAVERAEREGELLPRRAPGAGGDYRGQRDYVRGDSLSRVEWKSWLRLRRFQTREFEAEGAAPVTFAFDAVPGPGTEERLGQLVWLVRTALRRGRSVGLELPGRAIPPGSGPAHRRALLGALALYGAKR